MKHLASFGLGSFLIFAATACFETDVIDDAGFQFWCGESLCDWRLVDGEVRRVSTWHDHDYGVQLVGAPVVISQAAARSARCTRIELIADVDPEAQVTVEVDFDADGASDWTRAVDGRGFRSLAWEIRNGTDSGAVFLLRKAAEGRAVIAQLRASSECD